MTSINDNGLHLKRPCLAVADLERSFTVYRDILGFTLDYRSEADLNSYLYQVFGFPPEAQLTFAAFNSEYETRVLALTEVKGIVLPLPTIPQRLALVIRVGDVESVIIKLQELGLKTVASHTFTAPPNLRFIEQAFWDYDGHLVVLYDVKAL